MANIQYYDVILKPVVTEKSMNAMSEKKYTFLVHPEANKSIFFSRSSLDVHCSSGSQANTLLAGIYLHLLLSKNCSTP